MSNKLQQPLKQLIIAAAAYGRVEHAKLARADWSAGEQRRWEHDVDAVADAFAEHILDQPEGRAALDFELDCIDAATFTLLHVRNRMTDYANPEADPPAAGNDRLDGLLNGPDIHR